MFMHFKYQPQKIGVFLFIYNWSLIIINQLVYNNKMSYLGIFVLFLMSDFAFSKVCVTQNPCECVLPNKTVINLLPVGLPERPRFHDIAFNISCLETYSYNPCFPFDSPDKATVTNPTHIRCTGASACVKGFGGSDGKSPEVHAIGLQDLAAFGWNETTHDYYIDYNISKSLTKLRVYLKCANESDGHILTMEEKKCSSDGLVSLTLSSICACPNGCIKSKPEDIKSSGLSTGSKLLIA